MNITFPSIILGLFFFSPALHAELIENFDGEKYHVKIISDCQEGELTCDKITFDSRSKKSGKSIVLKGKTFNTDCPGMCNFRGYQYKNGKYSYLLYSDDIEGGWAFTITKNEKVIDTDKGTLN